ncbi:transcription factor EC [Trichechus manatus latirostris]|uniref:Transcription factor EC n=1 Tax=Trichechus manatus latirostris TaxID=127582 RepID=A0A2Y9QMG9_TRIMA|nr:transcription factor EC [Trichechus manatus latirostris]
MLQALTGVQFQMREQLGEKERNLQHSQGARVQRTQFHMQFSYTPMCHRLFQVRPEISSSQLPSFSKVPAHLENPGRTQLQKAQRQQAKPFMTLDHQILNQTLKRSHPPAASGSLPVRHGHVSPDSDAGLTGRPLTKLLTLGEEDDNVEWHMEDVIENIIGMESSFKEEGTDSPMLIQRTHEDAIFLTIIQLLDLRKLIVLVCLKLQELEIQARAHGLPTLASLGTMDLGAQVTKQQTHPEQNSVDYCQQLTLSQGPSPELCDQAMAFSDPLSHFTDLSFSAALKEEQRLDVMLLDDTISPFGTDPLLSATSPTASKESSRRSSFSSDDGDEL